MVLPSYVRLSDCGYGGVMAHLPGMDLKLRGGRSSVRLVEVDTEGEPESDSPDEGV